VISGEQLGATSRLLGDLPMPVDGSEQQRRTAAAFFVSTEGLVDDVRAMIRLSPSSAAVVHVMAAAFRSAPADKTGRVFAQKSPGYHPHVSRGLMHRAGDHLPHKHPMPAP